MPLSASSYWKLIHAERMRVARVLEDLTVEQWRSGSLCAEWTVEQVAAHLTAVCRTGAVAWMRSIVLAGFNADRHNARRVAEHLGRSPQETGQKFRDSVMLTIAPSKDYPAWLGEVIVHGQDIARPLGITLTPDLTAVGEVATFFAAKDFAVKSRSAVKGLALSASDATFQIGEGPLVRGPLLSLVMAMSGRHEYCEELEGDGVAELRERTGSDPNAG